MTRVNDPLGESLVDIDMAVLPGDGLHEARDLIGAVRMLRQRPDVDGDRVGVIGTSMGGNTVQRTPAT